MKNEVFNPDDWGMPSASEKGAAAPSPAAAGLSPNNDTIFALVDAVEASGIDITPTYSAWLAIGFALVSELGEEGRQLFHRLTALDVAVHDGTDLVRLDLHVSGHHTVFFV